MRAQQEMVREFHQKHGFSDDVLKKWERLIKVIDGVVVADDWRWWRLIAERNSLMQEEPSELSRALVEGDLVKVADAIADSLYVILGTAVALGIDAQAIFEEVHRSNMTKDVASNGGWHPKGPNFRPPDLRPLLEKMGVLGAEKTDP